MLRVVLFDVCGLVLLWLVVGLMAFVCCPLVGCVYIGFGVFGIALPVIVLFDLVFIFYLSVVANLDLCSLRFECVGIAG